MAISEEEVTFAQIVLRSWEDMTSQVQVAWVSPIKSYTGT